MGNCMKKPKNQNKNELSTNFNRQSHKDSKVLSSSDKLSHTHKRNSIRKAAHRNSLEYHKKRTQEIAKDFADAPEPQNEAKVKDHNLQPVLINDPQNINLN